MIRRRKRPAEDSTIDITPMLDIVFIMLIFFIVTTTFIKETGVEVNRPNASTAVADERGNRLGMFFSFCISKTALFIGVPKLANIKKILSLLMSLLAAWTALGTWY